MVKCIKYLQHTFTSKISPMKKLLLFLAVFTFTLISCEKIDYVQSEPQLEFTVVQGNMIFVEGATISLFETQLDWESQTNVIQSLKTNAKGQVIFENLKEQKYYFFVEKDELNNLADIAATWDPLKKGQRSQLLVKISETTL